MHSEGGRACAWFAAAWGRVRAANRIPKFPHSWNFMPNIGARDGRVSSARRPPI